MRRLSLLSAIALTACGGASSTGDMSPGDGGGPVGHDCTPDMICVPYDHWSLPDGVPDPKDLAATLCESFCSWIAEATDGCATGLAASTCPAMCQQMFAGGRQANVACFANHCSSACLQSGALPTPPACVQACMHADACKQLYLLDLPDDPAACQVMCAGLAAAWPSFAAALPCAAPALAACDLTTAVACFPDGASQCGWCDDGGCWGHPGALYADTPACVAGCSGGGFDRSWASSRCYELLACSTSNACIDAPILPACQAWAESLLATCGTKAWPPTVALAARDCSILAYVYNLMPSSDHPPVCSCGQPHSPQPPRSQFQSPQACTDACTAMIACGLFQNSSIHDCETECLTVSGNVPATLSTIAACAASANCAQVGNCFAVPGEHSLTFCERWCNVRSVCEPSSAPTCLDDCSQSLSGGDTSLVSIMTCLGAGDCNAFARCRAAAPFAVDPACSSTCTDGICHHISIAGDDGAHACTAACSEALSLAGKSGDATSAACFVAHVDHDCALAPGCF
jgi:hypothetical protein